VTSEIDRARTSLLTTAVIPEHLASYLDDLETRGYDATLLPDGSIGWLGPVPKCLVEDGHTTASSMTVTFQPGWPYRPPLLDVPGIHSWHADRERLCPWRDGDATLEWATVDGLMTRIDVWSEAAVTGFAGEPAALNPEIYWQEPIDGLLFGLIDVTEFGLTGDAPTLDGHSGRLSYTEYAEAGRTHPGLLQLRRRKWRSDERPPGLRAKDVRARFFYRSFEQGRRPPTGWSELLEILTPVQRELVDRDLQDDHRQLATLLVWDTGDGQAALLVLHDRAPDPTWKRTLVVLRPNGLTDLLRRAGPDATSLQSKRVVVLGLGAIGSYAADLLARCGVGNMDLVDADVVWPGNRVRFAVHGPPPMKKVEAIRHALGFTCPWTRVTVVAESPWLPARILELAQHADLVVDATGDIAHADLTARVCAATETPLVTSALYRGGTVTRTQRQAQDGTPIWARRNLNAHPEIPALADELEYAGIETGCLAPVHNAPPHAVARAAGLLVEVAIDHLTERQSQPDDIIEVLRPSGDWFDSPGRIHPNDYPFVADLTERARATILHAAQATHPNEAGGILVGVRVEDRPVIADAIVVPPAGPPTTDKYSLDLVAAKAALEEAQGRDRRLGYLGTWHTHPTGSDPSKLDNVTFRRTAADPETGNPLFLIARRLSDREVIDGFRVTTSGIRQIEMREAGNLPANEGDDR
jgi:proteasome lid subunit RPN8/RPN11